jgi:hypothetical protein
VKELPLLKGSVPTSNPCGPDAGMVLEAGGGIKAQFMDPATIPDYKVVLGGHAGSRFFHDPVLYLSAGLLSPDDFRL